MLYITDEAISTDMAQVLKDIIDEMGFVILRSSQELNLEELTVFFGECMKVHITQQETTITTLAPYINAQIKNAGFSFGNILPHTDFAFMSNPPQYIFIKMLQPDILSQEYGKNGIVDVYALVRDYRGSKLIHKLSKHCFGFLSGNQQSIAHYPILTLDQEEFLKTVRFHLPSLLNYYTYNCSKPSPKESQLLHDFLDLCKTYEQYFALDRNDILIVDNHLMLYSRTSINAKAFQNNIQTRKVEVAFVIS